jgi:hypothetical protein
MLDLAWWQKAGIGAVGGLALALLKLIDAKFFLSSVSSVESHAAYLTYLCYMILGSVAAVFLADHELPTPKVRRSAFILGLLAPSVLLAIANQPFKPSSSATLPPQIPSLSAIFISSAYAEEPSAPAKQPTALPALPAVLVLPKSSVQPSFANAFTAALGRKELSEPYAYVIGKTDDRQKAVDTASKMNLVLSGKGTSSVNLPLARVIQLQGHSAYFVLVGDLAPKERLTQLRLAATSSAIQSFGSGTLMNAVTAKEQKVLADLLLNAPVVPARSLADE